MIAIAEKAVDKVTDELTREGKIQG